MTDKRWELHENRLAVYVYVQNVQKKKSESYPTVCIYMLQKKEKIEKTSNI